MKTLHLMIQNKNIQKKILVIGPKDFPKVLNKIGHWIGSTKRYFSDIQNKMTKIDEDITSDDPEQKYSKKNVENGEKKND